MCLGHLRVQLIELRELVAALPDQAQQGRAAYHPHADVPGGDALVMLAPGNKLRTSHPDEKKSDPRPPLTVLTWWVLFWQRQLGHGSMPQRTTPELTDYLLNSLSGLALNPTLPVMARDIARLVRRTEDVLHDGVRPETSRVPCWECGTRLEKVYASKLADDHWLCPRCGESYDRGRFDRAKHDHLASEGAARFVHISDAASAIGRPKATLETWVRRELVTTQRHPRTGRRMVWWPDVRAAHLARPRRSAMPDADA